MKKSEFIQKVLKSNRNTVFTTPEQVENSLSLFIKLGMIPPKRSIEKLLLGKYSDYLEDDGCHGIVCKFSWRDYRVKVPGELIPYLKEVNMGDYTMVVLDAEEVHGWDE